MNFDFWQHLVRKFPFSRIRVTRKLKRFEKSRNWTKFIYTFGFLQHNCNISFDEITLLITDHSSMSSSFKLLYSRATVSFRSVRHPTQYKWPIITTWDGGVTQFNFNGPSATATGAFKTYRIPNWIKRTTRRPSISLLFQKYHFLIVVAEWKMPIVLHIICDLTFVLKMVQCRIAFFMVVLLVILSLFLWKIIALQRFHISLSHVILYR